MDQAEKLKITAFGDAAILVKAGNDISLETNLLVRKTMLAINSSQVKGVIEMVPAYNELMVYYDPLLVKTEVLVEAIKNASVIAPGLPLSPARLIKIPVLYGGEYGPDLQEVARTNKLSPEEVIAIHSQMDYPVFMMGFSPGFCYLGGMDERIACNRKANPRLKIPSGAVGIAGKQTGIYPLDSPGGWQIIGQTPVRLFRPGHTSPFLLQAGDTIRFVPVGKALFDTLTVSSHEPETIILK